jgi:D-sedoheptulose 7-phosphate isomerase
MSKELISQRIQEALEVKTSLLTDDQIIAKTNDIASLCITALKNGNKIMYCGNGGSAVDSMHLAAELTGRYYKDRAPLNAEALSADNAFITAVGNDYGFENIFSRMIAGKGKKGDVLMGLSTSGNSANVVKAFEKCREMGIITIGFTGASTCKMDELSDVLIKVPSADTPRIQEGHMLLGHIICEIVENAFL